MLNQIDPRVGAFFLVTGVSFFAFASGFTVCLFDMDQIDECAAVSSMWLDRFIEFGTHIINWFFELFFAILRHNGA